MLRYISASARLKTGTSELFQWEAPDGRVATIEVGRYLDDFAKLVGVPTYKARDGKGEPWHWHWHPHQFRRFFAVLYFYRFDGASIEALSHHLRHFNIEMTRRYVTMDPEVAALWTDVEWGYMGHIARQIVAGERSVSGAAGERIRKTARRLLDVFRRKLLIVTPDRIAACVVNVMQRKGMVLTPKPWVTCSCPKTRDAAITAACRRSEPSDSKAVGPDFANAGPTVCPKCPHGLIESTRRAHIDGEITHLDAAIASQSRVHTLFGELERGRVIELRSVLDSQYRNLPPGRA